MMILLKKFRNAKKTMNNQLKKTVDEVIDSMKDGKFDKFTKGVIDSIHKKRGYDPHDDDSKKETTTLVL